MKLASSSASSPMSAGSHLLDEKLELEAAAAEAQGLQPGFGFDSPAR